MHSCFLWLATRRPNPSPEWFGLHEVFHEFTIAGSSTITSLCGSSFNRRSHLPEQPERGAGAFSLILRNEGVTGSNLVNSKSFDAAIRSWIFSCTQVARRLRLRTHGSRRKVHGETREIDR